MKCHTFFILIAASEDTTPHKMENKRQDFIEQWDQLHRQEESKEKPQPVCRRRPCLPNVPERSFWDDTGEKGCERGEETWVSKTEFNNVES